MLHKLKEAFSGKRAWIDVVLQPDGTKKTILKRKIYDQFTGEELEPQQVEVSHQMIDQQNTQFDNSYNAAVTNLNTQRNEHLDNMKALTDAMAEALKTDEVKLKK